MPSPTKISLFCVLVSVVTAAFTPPHLFCATAGGQIACNIPCPDESINGSPSEYCTGLTKNLGRPSMFNFSFCLSTSGESVTAPAPGTNFCPSRGNGRCSDIGKKCALPKGVGPSAAQECPTSGDCASSGHGGGPSPDCDGTCGCGCAFSKGPTWLGIPNQAPAPVDGCALKIDGSIKFYDVTDAASIYAYCV